MCHALFFPILFIFWLCWVLLLHELFSAYGEQGLLFSCRVRLLIVGASLIVEQRPEGMQASLAVARGPSSFSSQAPEHSLCSCGAWA